MRNVLVVFLLVTGVVLTFALGRTLANGDSSSVAGYCVAILTAKTCLAVSLCALGRLMMWRITAVGGEYVQTAKVNVIALSLVCYLELVVALGSLLLGTAILIAMLLSIMVVSYYLGMLIERTVAYVIE